MRTIKPGNLVKTPLGQAMLRRKNSLKVGLNSLNNGSQNLPILPSNQLRKITSREIKALNSRLDNILEFKNKSGIHIKKENEGKFTATKKKTGKTTAELAKSKNPLTRKRAIFAQNAKKWHHKKKEMSDTSGIFEFAAKQISARLDRILFDSRPRNTEGQFTNEDQGPNPNDMAKVYNSGQNTGIAEGAGATAVGAAALPLTKALLSKLRRKP